METDRTEALLLLERWEDLTAEWHDSVGDMTLAQYLGLTVDEYDRWCLNPMALAREKVDEGWEPPELMKH